MFNWHLVSKRFGSQIYSALTLKSLYFSTFLFSVFFNMISNYSSRCYFFILMVQKSKRTHLSETVISKQNLFSIVSDARLVQDNRFISTVSIGPCQGVKILYLMRSKKIAWKATPTIFPILNMLYWWNFFEYFMFRNNRQPYRFRWIVLR